MFPLLLGLLDTLGNGVKCLNRCLWSPHVHTFSHIYQVTHEVRMVRHGVSRPYGLRGIVASVISVQNNLCRLQIVDIGRDSAIFRRCCRPRRVFPCSSAPLTDIRVDLVVHLVELIGGRSTAPFPLFLSLNWVS